MTRVRPDDAPRPPPLQRAGDSRTGRADQAGQFLLRQQGRRDVRIPVQLAALFGRAAAFGQVKQQARQPLGAAQQGMAPLLLVGNLLHLNHGLPVRVPGEWVEVQEIPELLGSDEQRPHRTQRLHGRGAVASQMSGHLAHDLSPAAQRLKGLPAIMSNSNDLYPARLQDKNMRCRLSLQAQYSAGRECPGSRCRDEILTISLAEQPPEIRSAHDDIIPVIG